MKTKEHAERKLNIVKDKLHRLLECTDGIVTEEIVEVSQALDDLIMEEMRKHNYNRKK